MIDKVYILNLPRETYRLQLCHASLLSLTQVPEEKLEVFEAMDNLEYQKSQDICKAAIADGFPGFQNYIDGGWPKKESIGIFALAWSQARFFRHVCEENITACLFLDDRTLGTPFQELDTLVCKLKEIDTSFKYLNTTWGRGDKAWYGKGGKRCLPELPSVAYNLPLNSPVDAVAVISPEGAAWFLEHWVGANTPRFEQFWMCRLPEKGIYTIVSPAYKEAMGVNFVVPSQPSTIHKIVRYPDGSTSTLPLREIEDTS